MSDVAVHYGRGGLGEAILEALGAAGKDPDAPTREDLAPVDQFHTGGRDATLELARRAGIARDATVLDVGGGLGGAARLLAAELGCRVTVLDLTEEYCRVGADLTRRIGLEAQVGFRHGDALAMPFAAGAFDVAWTHAGPLGLHLLLGRDFATMLGNLARNLDEGRVRVVMGVCERA